MCKVNEVVSENIGLAGQAAELTNSLQQGFHSTKDALVAEVKERVQTAYAIRQNVIRAMAHQQTYIEQFRQSYNKKTLA